MADGDKAIKGTTGWYRFAHALSTAMPRSLARSAKSRRRIRALRKAGS